MKLNLDGDKRMAIEREIVKLHLAPYPNSKVTNDEINTIIDISWKEFGHFQNKTGVYGLRPVMFLLPDVLTDNSYLWHEILDVMLIWKAVKLGRS